MEQDIDYKGYRIKIRQSEFSESPDDWGNDDIFLVYDHRQFDVRREGFAPEDIFDYLSIKKALTKENTFQDKEELEDDLKGYFDYESEYWIFPVDAYIHSGVHISLANTKDYPDRRWDVSTTGYILASKEDWTEVEDAYKAAESLVEEWNQYLSGEVYGFIIEKPLETYTITKENLDKIKSEDNQNGVDIVRLDQFEELSCYDVEWEQIDSCWGYYGDPETSGLLDEAKAVIDYRTRDE